jgi:hypothetical protein
LIKLAIDLNMIACLKSSVHPSIPEGERLAVIVSECFPVRGKACPEVSKDIEP